MGDVIQLRPVKRKRGNPNWGKYGYGRRETKVKPGMPGFHGYSPEHWWVGLPAKTVKNGDFTEEEILEMEKRYGAKIHRP